MIRVRKYLSQLDLDYDTLDAVYKGASAARQAVIFSSWDGVVRSTLPPESTHRAGHARRVPRCDARARPAASGAGRANAIWHRDGLAMAAARRRTVHEAIPNGRPPVTTAVARSGSAPSHLTRQRRSRAQRGGRCDRMLAAAATMTMLRDSSAAARSSSNASLPRFDAPQPDASSIARTGRAAAERLRSPLGDDTGRCRCYADGDVVEHGRRGVAAASDPVQERVGQPEVCRAMLAQHLSISAKPPASSGVAALVPPTVCHGLCCRRQTCTPVPCSRRRSPAAMSASSETSGTARWFAGRQSRSDSWDA